MGKHTAGNDAAVHPLVADALVRRAGTAGAAHEADTTPGGSTGWPEPQPGGGGSVGWPDDARPDGETEPQKGADEDVERAVVPAGPQPRRGWRRLFGAGSAA